MDSLSTLQALGLSLPSATYIAGAVLFGLVGLWAYRAGKRAGRPRTRWLGVALMLYPYAVPQTWLLYLIGTAMCAVLWVDRA